MRDDSYPRMKSQSTNFRGRFDRGYLAAELWRFVIISIPYFALPTRSHRNIQIAFGRKDSFCYRIGISIFGGYFLVHYFLRKLQIKVIFGLYIIDLFQLLFLRYSQQWFFQGSNSNCRPCLSNLAPILFFGKLDEINFIIPLLTRITKVIINHLYKRKIIINYIHHNLSNLHPFINWASLLLFFGFLS